jgi:hypothetical protein
LGWIIDLAAHFAYWKLHRLRLVYKPRFVSPAATAAAPASAGMLLVGVVDDPARLPTSGFNIMELRSAGEYDLSRPFALDYIPTGRAADWLWCDRENSLTNSNIRQVDAGVLVFNSSIASSFVSGTIGMMYWEFDVSFKGASLYQAPTLALSAGEEKKEVSSKGVATQVGAGLGLRACVHTPEDGYELVSHYVKPASVSTMSPAVLKKS